MGTAAQTLAGFVADLRYADLPRDVVAAARRHLLDAAGAALAAADAGAATPILEMIRSWSGAREASVIGQDFGAPAPLAAMANAAQVHALHLDDTHLESVVHPSAVIMPAALAVAEEVGAGGRELLVATVAGYEVATRVGAAAPGRFHARGQHTTGVCGGFGATAAAAALWRLGVEEIAGALGIAGSHAAGLFAVLDDGSESRWLQPAWAAHAGVVAADLARRGVRGPVTVLDGPHGLFAALLEGEEPDHARLTRGLGTEWETTRIALKPHAASDFVLAFMDAAAGAGVKWADVEEVVCFVSPAVIGIVCEPRAPRLHPMSTDAAQFSLPFAVATSIVGGRGGLELFGEEARADRRVLTLAERVHHEPDPTLPFPRTYGGRLRIHTRGGRTIEVEEIVNRGHPDRPLSEEEIAEKFLANARRRLGAKGARRALTRFERLEEIDDAVALARLVTIA